jgi:signal transduction histidine kinase
MGSKSDLQPSQAGEGQPSPDQDVVRADADLNHKLCNLLQVVTGYLEMLARRTDDDVSLGYIATARTAADQLIDLSRQLPGSNLDR